MQHAAAMRAVFSLRRTSLVTVCLKCYKFRRIYNNITRNRIGMVEIRSIEVV